jgi:hypothetical protein
MDRCSRDPGLDWLMNRPTGTPTGVSTAEHLRALAKDWTRARLAAAPSSPALLPVHRFELSATGVRRIHVPSDSVEAESPVNAVARVGAPTVWVHSVVVTRIVDVGEEAVGFDQEVIELLEMEDDSVRAEAAVVLRIPGLGVCLGPFEGLA